ncbi:hypothetical protein BLA60_03940 [Actinophytocola xinjiangensis]|uniref:CdiI immunity protein domain-containing protein n=1 Tax=Actinophytocola xinjiangensis TaxID=485602 RepID=A0A7Z0WS34_9PSEU|nr:hypothetical protein [Actinophytocola xinjiangensis]OLF14296.1 hypothetical protein BLA60_03940 [Actinophytocola xinjiangensis]
MTIEHRAELNSVIYGLFRAPSLEREVAASMVEAMIAREYFLDGPQAYSQAIAQALNQADPVTADLQPPYNEADVRAFLALVHEELEKTRPWAP